MIERCCQLATQLEAALRAAGFEVLNEVALNQVMVSFGAPEDTLRVMRGLQAEGTGWAGTTVWHGHTAMRISVSSWATTEADVARMVATLTRLAAKP